jgi:hypothetical protein
MRQELNKSERSGKLRCKRPNLAEDGLQLGLLHANLDPEVEIEILAT